MKEYVTIDGMYSGETVIEKSRFIATVCGINSPDDAAEAVARVKKQHPFATHNCYAYLCGDAGKFSDDGEPQGTAGRPIYECLKNSGLDKVVAIVTRYFGGVKLGAGGLVRAYSGAVSSVLKEANKVVMRRCRNVIVSVSYEYDSAVRSVLSDGIFLSSVDYSEQVAFTLLVLADFEDTITDIIQQKTRGTAEILLKEEVLKAFPLTGAK